MVGRWGRGPGQIGRKNRCLPHSPCPGGTPQASAGAPGHLQCAEEAQSDHVLQERPVHPAQTLQRTLSVWSLAFLRDVTMPNGTQERASRGSRGLRRAEGLKLTAKGLQRAPLIVERGQDQESSSGIICFLEKVFEGNSEENLPIWKVSPLP